jgi:hypothetical protein
LGLPTHSAQRETADFAVRVFSAAPINPTVILSGPCSYYEFEGPVRVPGGATNGMARVRVSIPGWDRIDLANPSFEIKIED